MDAIHHQARVAQRRLGVERFLNVLPRYSFILLAAALLGLALPCVVVMQVDKVAWFAGWLSAAGLGALIVSVIIGVLRRPTLADAAIEIDRRLELRERLSSALLLSPEDRQTDLGRALMADAEKRASQIDVRSHFRWGAHRGLLWPMLPVLLAVGLWFLPFREADSSGGGLAQTHLNPVLNSTKPLMEQLRRKREEAEKAGLKEAADMFRQLEGELAKLQQDKQLDTKQSLAKLNDLKQQIDKRREELGSSEALKKNLQGLEKLEPGPANELGEALKRGDFDKAQSAVEKLLDKMQAQDGLSQPDKQKLEKQLEQLEKSLNDAVAAHEQAKQALQQQIQQAAAAGDNQKMAQLERKLAQLQSQDSQMQQMQELSSALSEAKERMQQGDQQGAKEALQKMASQLQEMNQANSQLQDLDELMDKLSQSKSQMMCQQCQGQGCSQCMGAGMGKMADQLGSGLGEGRGQGERPEQETDTDFFESRVREQMKPGETLYGGKVGGENRKGNSKAEVQSAVRSSLAEEPEPLDNQPLPKSQRQHTREYFNALRDGKK